MSMSIEFVSLVLILKFRLMYLYAWDGSCNIQELQVGISIKMNYCVAESQHNSSHMHICFKWMCMNDVLSFIPSIPNNAN